MADLRSAPLAPLAPDDHVRGDPEHPLLVLYSDFTCPHCALTHARLRGVRARLAFRHFALRARHPRSLALAHAAEAAARQGCFWEMHDSLFADPGHTDDPHLWERARRLALDLERFERDRRSAAVAERVRRDVRQGMRAGVSATPTLYAGGLCHPGVPDARALARLLDGEARAPDSAPGRSLS